MIVPGPAFKITLNSEDANRTVVQNLGRAIVKKTTIKISGNELMSLYDSDNYRCYNDLWKIAQERENAQYKGIDESDNRNTTRIRVSAGNKNTSITADKAKSYWISICSRATCRSIRARSGTAWIMNSPSPTTTA